MKQALVVGALAAGAVLLPQVAMAADLMNMAPAGEGVAGSFGALNYSILGVCIGVMVLSWYMSWHAVVPMLAGAIFAGTAGANWDTFRTILVPNVAAGAEIDATAPAPEPFIKLVLPK